MRNQALKKSRPSKNLINPKGPWKNYAGLDEAGRGAWAGPVVAAAVVLKENIKLPKLDDSKKLTAKTREALYKKIITKNPYGIGEASNHEVDQFGLLHATFLAFKRALESLKKNSPEVELDHLYIDGRDHFEFEIPKTSVIRGDGIYRCIAAASIIAKVTRDQKMLDFAKKFPHYEFDKHKGYGTQAHQTALQKHKPCELHRLSYAPLQKILCTQKSFC